MPSEADLPDPPHPRDRDLLLGQESASLAMESAERAGRLHHAWLIGGPPGIGKATLAYRFARHLLAPPAERTGGLGVDMAGRTARRISAGAHPNLFVLQRPHGEGEKVQKTVSVEAVRRALGFFATTATDGGRRICIVDPVEDLTPAAANALLKTVEEPPAGALVLIVSHAPSRVLPTIRSRCRAVSLAPLGEDDLRAAIASLSPAHAALDPSLVAKAARHADGSVARALDLLDPKRIALLEEVGALLDALPALAIPRLSALADRLGDRRAEEAFGLALDRILRWLGERVEAGQGRGAARLAPLADVCEKIVEAAQTLEVYNLDRRAFIVSTFGDLAEAVRRAA